VELLICQASIDHRIQSRIDGGPSAGSVTVSLRLVPSTFCVAGRSHRGAADSAGAYSVELALAPQLKLTEEPLRVLPLAGLVIACQGVRGGVGVVVGGQAPLIMEKRVT